MYAGLLYGSTPYSVPTIVYSFSTGSEQKSGTIASAISLLGQLQTLEINKTVSISTQVSNSSPVAANKSTVISVPSVEVTTNSSILLNKKSTSTGTQTQVSLVPTMYSKKIALNSINSYLGLTFDLTTAKAASTSISSALALVKSNSFIKTGFGATEAAMQLYSGNLEFEVAEFKGAFIHSRLSIGVLIQGTKSINANTISTVDVANIQTQSSKNAITNLTASLSAQLKIEDWYKDVSSSIYQGLVFSSLVIGKNGTVVSPELVLTYTHHSNTIFEYAHESNTNLKYATGVSNKVTYATSITG